MNAVPAVCALAVPVLPLPVAGAAVSPGMSTCNLAKSPGPTTMLLEFVAVKPLAVKLMLIVFAKLCDRLVNVTTPPAGVRLVVPCNVPLPRLRAAVTTVLLSLLRKLPNWSSIRITGWLVKAAPAAAVEEGCV